MNLQNISFFRLLFFLIECYILEIASQTKNNRFLEPCFEEDENLGKCTTPDNSCDLSANVDEVKLVRLPGLRVSKIILIFHLFVERTKDYVNEN